MNIVIGAQGQDGSYVVERLAAEKSPYIGISRQGICSKGFVPLQTEDLLQQKEYCLEDWVHDYVGFATFLQDVKAINVFDCAASHTSTNRFNRVDQKAMYMANVERTTCLQRSLLVLGDRECPPRLITCGSSLMYSGYKGLVVSEDTEMMPNSGYGYAKKIAREQCEVLRHFGFEACMAILFNHDSPRRPKEYFLPRAISAIKNLVDKKEIDSFGNLQKRIDIGSARDVADALVGISKIKNINSDYVVATGHLHTLAELVDYAGEALGLKDASLLLGDGNKGLVSEDYLLGDISKIKSDVGWSPKETIFDVIDSIIARSVNDVKG